MAEDPAGADKAAAFEDARRKFAAYSRAGSRRAASHCVAGCSRLRSTASLQLNGELAAQLADVDYHLTGILDGRHREGGGDATALAASVVELAGLLRKREVLAAVLSARSDPGSVCARIRQVIRSLLPPRARHGPSQAEDGFAAREDDARDGATSVLLRLGVAVLLYTVALDADAAVVLVDEGTFAAAVGALKAEIEALANGQGDPDDRAVLAVTRAERRSDGPSSETTVAYGSGSDAAATKGPVRDGTVLLKKMCLKRKSTGDPASAVSRDNESSTENEACGGRDGPRRRRFESNGAAVRARLHALVAGDAALVVPNGRASLTTADVLLATLHNLLQIESTVGSSAAEPDDARVAAPAEGGDNNPQSTETSALFHPEPNQSGATMLLDQRQGVHAVFKAARDRKAWLVRSGALDTLRHALNLRLAPLVDLEHPSSSGIRALREECELADIEIQQIALQRLRAVLQVLEQAAFFADNVQRRLSADRELFAVLLAIVHDLGDVCWSSKEAWTSIKTRECATEAVDVSLAAMRLLINLTHQNAVADSHMSSLDGMRTLFDTFCRMRCIVEGPPETSAPSSRHSVEEPLIDEKLVFDTYLLLLSAMANCVENSEENRRALSQLTPPDDCGESRATVCSLLTQFFLAKVQSYIQLIDGSSNAAGGQASDAGGDWSPDDVILGGCTALLLGCLMADSSGNVGIVLALLPERSPRLLLRALAVFVALHAQIGALTPEVAASVLRVETSLKRIEAASQGLLQCEQACPSDREATPSRSDIVSPHRGRQVKDSTGASTSPGRRRRNLWSSLSDSDDEMEVRGREETVDGSPSSHGQDAGAIACVGTPERAQASASKSPSRSRLGSRPSPSSLRTPSPRRRLTPTKSSKRRPPRASSVGSVGDTSRRLLKEARSLIDDLDAEFARASATSSCPHDHSSQPSVSGDGGDSSSASLLERIPVEHQGHDQDSDQPSVNNSSALARVRRGNSPAQPKKTERTPKRKDYRLPTSPFRRMGHRQAAGVANPGQSATAESLVTPVRRAGEMSTLEQRRLPVDLDVDQSSVDESPARRKAKRARAAPPPSLASAIFDFDD